MVFFSEKHQISAENIDKLSKKNVLLDVLGTARSSEHQTVVVGDTSVGKSTTINFLLGFPIHLVAGGVGTRRPAVLTLTPDPDRTELKFRVKFVKEGTAVDKTYSNLADVADFVNEANNPERHPGWFDCLREDLEMKPEDAFDKEPILVEVSHKDLPLPMRLVDLPGLKRGNDLPMQIARHYIQPGNVVILVIGRDNPNNGGFPGLAASMKSCSKTIVIQNFIASTISDGQFANNQKAINEVMQTSNRLPTIYCVDYGLAKGEDTAGIWRNGLDQDDWRGICAEQGITRVVEAMHKHNKMRADHIRSSFEDVFSQGNLVVGLQPVRDSLVSFQFDNIDQQIVELQAAAQRKLREMADMLGKANKEIAMLKDPPEWGNMLSSVAEHYSNLLESVLPVSDMLDVGLQWTSHEEVANIKSSGFEHEVEEETRSWVHPDFDKKVCDLITRFEEFRSDAKLVGLRARQRLLDEFTAMIVFSPFHCIRDSTRAMAISRLGQGPCAKPHFDEELLGMIIRSKAHGTEGFIRPLLAQFLRRLKCIVKRDLEVLNQILCRSPTTDIERFLKLVEGESTDGPRCKDRLLSKINDALHDHALKVMESMLIGQTLRNEQGDPVIDSSNRRKVQLKSGLMVRENDNTFQPGVLHWMLPAKTHLLNGQFAAGDLTLQPNGEEAGSIELPRGGWRPWVGGLLGGLFVLGGGFLAARRKQRRISGFALLGVGALIFKHRTLLQRGASHTQPTTTYPNRTVAVKSALSAEWNDELLEESILTRTSDSVTINSCNAVNLLLYRDATRPRPADLGTTYNLTDYTFEVLKLLKAAEMKYLSDWASMWPRMVQQLTGPQHVKRFIMDRFDGSRFVKRQAYESEASIRRAAAKPRNDVEEIVDSVLCDLNVLETSAETTLQEIQHSCEWLGMSITEHLDHAKRLLDQNTNGRFLHTMNEAFAGEPSLVRLCDEFTFVILQSKMRPVTPDELEGVRANASRLYHASEQDIIEKLTRHRIAELHRQEDILRKRLSYAWDRDVRRVLSTEMGKPRDLMDWVQEQLISFEQHMVDTNLQELGRKAQDLWPCDTSILNGLLPLGGNKLRAQFFELSTCGKRILKVDAKDDIRRTWLGLNQNEKFSRIFTSAEFESPMRLPGHAVRDAYERFQNPEDRVAQIFKLGPSSPPSEGFASGAFQQLALSQYKCIMLNAVQTCRPKLKAMYAKLHTQEELRRALEGSDHLDYLRDFGGNKLERAETNAKNLQHQIGQIDSALEQSALRAPGSRAPRATLDPQTSRTPGHRASSSQDLGDSSSFQLVYDHDENGVTAEIYQNWAAASDGPSGPGY